jgi:hypothetical protein
VNTPGGRKELKGENKRQEFGNLYFSPSFIAKKKFQRANALHGCFIYMEEC